MSQLPSARTIVMLGLAIASVTASIAGSDGPARQDQKTVFVAALDHTSIPITDLAKADWGVREDGVDRPIVSAARATEPLQVVLLVDTTREVERSVGELRKALQTFVQTLRAGGVNAIALSSVGGTSMTLAGFEAPAADLDRAAQRLVADTATSSVLLEALVESARTLSRRPSPRRAIVSINYDAAAEAGTMAPSVPAEAVLATRASYWALSYRDTSNAATAPRRDVLLTNLPPQTGGVHIRVNSSTAIEPNLKRMAEVLLAQYAVTYTRPAGPAPKLLQMAVARPGAQMIVPRVPPQ